MTTEVREGDHKVARGNESGNARTDRMLCVNRDGALDKCSAS
jgi:hypothetical protein